MNWKTKQWLCIDTETTGLDCTKDRLVEIGAVAFDGQIITKMGTLLNPGVPIPEFVSEIHGITDDDVADCPSVAQIKDRFLKHVREAKVLVGYNWPFDAGFLASAFGDDWAKAIAGKPVIDPLVLVRTKDIGKYWKGNGRYKLDAVAQRLGIKREGAPHRASSDCALTCRVLWSLKDHLPDDGAKASKLIAEYRKAQDEEFKRYRNTKLS